jgi:undecaprenyl-phosphate 4-deoxy-4-formamido-L-arabinose transferase
MQGMEKMKKQYSLSIVIPVYNGAATIGNLVDELAKLTVEGGLEIILVNDGSRDESAAVCESLVEKYSIPITFVNLARNFGEHNAVMAGLHYTRGEYVITMDDDMQNPPSEVIKLFNYARTSGKDVVYTSFQNKEHDSFRNFGSWLTNRAADVLLDKPKGFYLSSFRCMNAFVVEQICNYTGPFSYIDGLILQITQNIDTIEVIHLPRSVGRSNYTLRKLLHLWLNMFVNFSITPLHISTILGIVLSIVGILGVIEVTIEYFLLGTPRGFGTIVCTFLIFSGVQLFILGIIGEYIGRLHLTSNRKPQFVIRNFKKNR